jgi:hypothetical protein
MRYIIQLGEFSLTKINKASNTVAIAQLRGFMMVDFEPLEAED